MRGPGKRFSPPNLGSSSLPPKEALGENIIEHCMILVTREEARPVAKDHDQGWTAAHSKSPCNNAFDFPIGGGIDILVTEKITIRPAQFDYLWLEYSSVFNGA